MLLVQVLHIPLHRTLAELSVMSGWYSLLGMLQAWGPIEEELQLVGDGSAGYANRLFHILRFGCRRSKPLAAVLC